MKSGDSSPKIKKIVTTTRFEEEEHDGSSASEAPVRLSGPWAKIKAWNEKIGSLYAIVVIALAIAGAGYFVSNSLDKKVDKDVFETSMDKVADKLSKQDEKIGELQVKMIELEAKVFGRLDMIQYWVEETGKKNGVTPPPASQPAPSSP